MNSVFRRLRVSPLLFSRHSYKLLVRFPERGIIGSSQLALDVSFQQRKNIERISNRRFYSDYTGLNAIAFE